MGNKISLEEQLIDLRITTKQMQRSAKKCEKNEKVAIEKLKKVGTVDSGLTRSIIFIHSHKECSFPSICTFLPNPHYKHDKHTVGN
jgi:hypothetical protein